MRWMIRSDMEGLTGVVSMMQVVPGASEYVYGRKLLRHELDALLKGLLLEADDEVVIYDIHFFGTNIDLEQLDPRVTVIQGKPDYTPANQGWLAGGFDGVILQGLHARAGVAGALLAHNYEHDIVRMTLNGVALGEIGMEAAIAGDAGVPLVMVTGDSEGIKEAETMLPGIVTVAVKESLGSDSALCYAPARTARLLTEGARACREAARRLLPFVVPAPVVLEMQFKPDALLYKLQERLGPDFIRPDTLRLTGRSVLDVWERYLKAKA